MSPLSTSLRVNALLGLYVLFDTDRHISCRSSMPKFHDHAGYLLWNCELGITKAYILLSICEQVLEDVRLVITRIEVGGAHTGATGVTHDIQSLH